MAYCQFCGEKDETKLIMSTRVVKGRVETIDICFACLWREEFKAEGDGNQLSEQCGRKEESPRDIDPLSSQERI